MQTVQDQIRFESSVEFLQVPVRRPTKLVGTSPNIFGNEYWKANNNGTIVNFIGGVEGQTLRILGDGLTTIANNVNIKTAIVTNELLVANVVYRFTMFDGIWFEDVIGTGGGGGGEANTASNLGSGVGIFASKSGVDLRFKSLVAGTGISISSSGTEITITNTAGGGGSTSPGGSDTQIQYNNGGAFGGVTGVVWDDTNNYLTVGGTKRILQLGPTTSTLLTALLTTNNTFLHIEGDSTYIQPGIVLTDGFARSGGNKVSSMLYMSGGDWGLRLSYNYREPYVGGLSHTDADLPQNQFSLEQGGGIGYAYAKPFNVAAGTYDTEGGKDFILWPQGFFSSDGKRLEQVFIGCGNRNRGLDIGVRADASGSADYVGRIRIKSTAADATNPVYLWVGGALKQVVIDGSGFLKGV